MSKDAMKGGHAEHIHSNCDCQYTIRHDSRMTVAGYDPDEYLSMYRNAEGSTPQERINSMRREQYQSDAVTTNRRTFGLSAGQTNNRIPEHEPPVFIRELVDGEDRREVLLGYESQIADETIENAIVITKDGYFPKDTVDVISNPDTALSVILRSISIFLVPTDTASVDSTKK